LRVHAAEKKLPNSSHYACGNSCGFCCLVLGQTKICNLPRNNASVTLTGSQAYLVVITIYLWLVAVIQKDVGRLDVTMDNLGMT
jgi:hypothetical protein